MYLKLYYSILSSIIKSSKVFMSEAKDLKIAFPIWFYLSDKLYKYLGVDLSYFSDIPLPPIEAWGEATSVWNK